MSIIRLEIDDYWTKYCELESQFKNVIRYIPLVERHRDVISPKLADLSSIIGNCIETVFNRMANAGHPPQYPIKGIEDFNKNPCIDNFRKAFKDYYRLSEQRVKVLPHDYGIVKPFEEFSQSKNPGWFKVYSKYKHNIEELLSRSTLDLVTKSLAGLFLLDVFPFEMREYALKNRIIYSKRGEYKNYDTGAAMTETLLSHPHTLRGKFLPFIGNIIAESGIFRFEFARFTRDNDPTPYPSAL